jgi:surface polysaccharide O-acyltransferase-like enzyme
MSQKRENYIDMIKTFAIFGVIVIHICGAGLLHPVASPEWTGALAWRCLCGASVPLFFMCSGALMISRSELPLKRLWTHYIPRLLVALLFYAAVYKLWHCYEAGDFSAEALLQAGKDLLLFRHQTHLYYMHIILLVYAMLPVTRVFARKAQKDELRYFLAVWALLGIIYPTVRPFWPFSRISGIPAQYLINMTWAAIGYGVLGYYINKYPVKRGAATVSALAGLALMFAGTWKLTLHNALETTVSSAFLEGMSAGVCLLAFGLYSLARGIKLRPGRTVSAFTFLSKVSMFTYMIHMLVYFILQHFGLSVDMFTPWLSVPAMALLTWLLCAVLYVPVSKIPVINKLLC